MVLCVSLEEILTLIDPALYHKYIVVDISSKIILCVNLHKALYGYIRTALLFYENLAQSLNAMGLIINPYDTCVINKFFNEGGDSIVWNVDDLNLSHEN